MKLHKIVFTNIILSLFLINKHYSQDTSNIFIYPSAKKVNVMINSKVYKIQNTLIYNYKIYSEFSSQQNVSSFDLEFRNGSIDSFSSPYGWRVAKLRSIPLISWWSGDSLMDIKPGDVQDGFYLESQGLPLIRKFYIRGYIPCPIVQSEPDKIIGGSFFENSKKGKIIVPGSPPDPFIVNDFVDTLISYKHQAFELGWIDNQGILNSLDAKLDNIKKQLEKDQTTTAINGLKAFVNEVEAQKDKHLTSEAYALLKYNAEYLIEKLSEE